MNWIVFLIALVVIVGWFAWTYISVRRAAKFIDNAEFESMIHTSQLIDVREAAAFKKNILWEHVISQLVKFKCHIQLFVKTNQFFYTTAVEVLLFHVL